MEVVKSFAVFGRHNTIYITIAFFATSFLAFLLVFSLFVYPAYASWQTCTVRIRDIRIEKVDSVNRDRFCAGDRFRVRADISISSAGASVEARLYVDGDFYDNEIVYISDGGRMEIIFDRIIDSDDWVDADGWRNDPEIRVVAESYCGSDEETTNFYFDDWCCDYDRTLCDYRSYRDRTCDWCWPSDYGRLSVQITDCATDDAVTDATVEVSRGSYNVKTTHYDGYARFTLPTDTYTVAVSKSGYAAETEDVKICSGCSKRLDICLDKSCTEGFTGNMRCFGPYLQSQYLSSGCGEQWKTVEYCQNGCMDGICLPTTTTVGKPTAEKLEIQKTGMVATSMVAASMVAASRPLFALETVYEIEACKIRNFTFNVVNLGPEREFKFNVEGAGADLVYVPSSLVLGTGRHEVLAYAYMCEPERDEYGQYEFSVKAVADSVASTSHSTLKVSKAGSMLPLSDAFILSFAVIVVVLLLLKKLLPTAFGRVRKIAMPEDFRGSSRVQIV